MPKKKPKFTEGDVVECQLDGEYGSIERYLVYGYLPETMEYAVVKAVDDTECGTGTDAIDIGPDCVNERYLEKFGKKIGFVDLSIFMDGADI